MGRNNETEKTPFRATVIVQENTTNGLKQGNSDVQKGRQRKDTKLLESTKFGNWFGWRRILQVIYMVLMSNMLLRFSPKPSHVNVYSVFLLTPDRWCVLNTLELCLQSDLHSPIVPMEETMTPTAVNEGRGGVTHGQITPRMENRWALMGF